MPGSGSGGHVVWQGSPEQPVQGSSRRSYELHNGQQGYHARQQGYQPNQPALEDPDVTPERNGVASHDYEYEQQRQLDANRGEAEQPEGPVEEDIRTQPQYEEAATNASTPHEDVNNLKSPWEPLNVRRDHSATPEPVSFRDANLGAPINIPNTDTDHTVQTFASPTSIEMPPKPTSFASSSAPTPGDGSFYTPMEGPTPVPEQASTSAQTSTFSQGQSQTRPSPPPVSITSVPVGGKISAAAFRRAAKPRTSLDTEDPGSTLSPTARKLPLPPGRAETPIGVGVALPGSPGVGSETQGYGQGFQRRVEDDAGSFAEARGETEAPPVYGGNSLR